MIVSAKKIVGELNQEYGLLENISSRAREEPEGVGIDVRAGKAYEIEGAGYLGVEGGRLEREEYQKPREYPNSTKIADVDDEESKRIVGMNPGDYVLVETMETINLPGERVEISDDVKPRFLMADVYPRSSLQRSGVYFKGTKTDPGYSGTLVFAMANLTDDPFMFEIGARVANLAFKMVEGGLVREYQGQNQGGRTTTEGTEEQN